MTHLLGQLSACTDYMPRTLCDQLDLPQGSNYTMGVEVTAFPDRRVGSV